MLLVAEFHQNRPDRFDAGPRDRMKEKKRGTNTSLRQHDLDQVRRVFRSLGTLSPNGLPGSRHVEYGAVTVSQAAELPCRESGFERMAATAGLTRVRIGDFETTVVQLVLEIDD